MNRLLSWPGHTWLALPMRLYLGCVFLLACQHKIAHPESFAIDVATYGILPLSLVNIMAITLPWIELTAGIFLVAGLKTRAAALMTFGMMVMFIVALAIEISEHGIKHVFFVVGGAPELRPSEEPRGDR